MDRRQVKELRGGCDMKRRQRQEGGCGGFQSGGGKKLTPVELVAASADWRAKVMKLYKEHKGEVVGKKKDGSDKHYTIRDAMKALSTGISKKKYLAKRKPGYVPRDKKNKRPVTMDAAKAILLKYYRDRAANFKDGPLRAMRSKLGRCHTKGKHVLTACEAGVKGKPIVTPACAGSWKYRPTAAKRSGPGVYALHAPNGGDWVDSCLKSRKEKKSSDLYKLSPRGKAWATWAGPKRVVKKAAKKKATAEKVATKFAAKLFE